MQTGNGGVEEEQRNDQRRRGFARQPQHHRNRPEQSSDDANVQTGNGKKMEGTGLLERFFDVLACLMTEPERGAADQADHVRRIFNAATQSALHPFA